MGAKLKIGLDARVATIDLRGFGRYSRSLIKALISLPSEIEWFLYTHDPGLKQIFPESERVHIRVLSGFMGLRSHLLLRSAAQTERLQLMYFFANNFWFWPECPTLITIHDTEPFEKPELYCHNLVDRIHSQYRKFRIKQVGTHFITDSEASRKDALSIFGLAPDKITTIYSGVDDALFKEQPDPADDQIRARFIPGDKPYIFFVGAHDYRKNLATLIRAFDLLKQNRRIPHQLVLAGTGGSDPRFYPPLKGIARVAENDIIFPGYIDDQFLPALYRGAQLFVFPSLKEGFGLPVLEAMACGVPVVSSKASSLPEVVADAGLLVNAEKESEIADAMMQVLGSPPLARELREKGLKQAARFRWEKAGQEVLELIPQIIQSSKA